MFYNTEKEAEAFVESVLNIRRRMGYDEIEAFIRKYLRT